MVKKWVYHGVSAWRLVLGPCGGGTSLYTLYYEDVKGSGLLTDTPAIDAKGRFLWCTNARKLECVHAKVTRKLARLAMTRSVGGCIDISRGLKGLDSDGESEHPDLWWETVDLINILRDYLNFLPNSSPEDTHADMVLEDLMCHMFEGKALTHFYASHKTSKREITQSILYGFYRVFDNSVII